MSHKQVTANPMSEARRNAVHGPLRPADDDSRFHHRVMAWCLAVTAAAVVYIIGSM